MNVAHRYPGPSIASKERRRMAKISGSSYRSAITGRYVTVKRGNRHPTSIVGDPMTKAGIARVEAAWKKASEATGAFQRRSFETRPRNESSK